MEPFVDQLNVTFEQTRGAKNHLRFRCKADGELATLSDTNECASAGAVAYLDGVMPVDAGSVSTL